MGRGINCIHDFDTEDDGSDDVAVADNTAPDRLGSEELEPEKEVSIRFEVSRFLVL